MTYKWQAAFGFAALVATVQAISYVFIGAFTATVFDQTEYLTAFLASGLTFPVTAVLFRFRAFNGQH